ncbi:MAG: acetylglutamate kinase [Candidatus Lokiarchaeota archaeon]|nr:acetylglutamate kinase [Candidatus Lokiarchaeota archaeon]
MNMYGLMEIIDHKEVFSIKKKVEQARILVEALQFIKKLNGKTIIIKYGGSVMKNPELKKSFVEDIIFMNLVGINIIIVHGGGHSIDKMLKKLNIEPKFYNGLRITDGETMEIVEMVLAGKVNKSIVNDIQIQGVNAIGVCGKDGNLLEAKKKIVDGKDLGFVGEVINVNTNFLKGIMRNSIIPVIAPIGKDNLGNTYNINADDVASAISKTLYAEKLVFLTDVMGVLSDVNDNTTLISEMNVDQALSYIKEGVIINGMIPKVKCCVEAIQSGVNAVHIIDGRIEHSLLLEIFTSQGIGTMFVK